MPLNHNQAIPASVRRDIFDTLILDKYHWYGRLSDSGFLARIYDLDSMPSTDHRHETAAGDIVRHREWNDDWPEDWILTDERFNLLKVPDEQFLRFLVEMVHPIVQPDLIKIHGLLDIINEHINPCGWELSQSGVRSGKPVFVARETTTTNDLARPIPRETVLLPQEPATFPVKVASVLATVQPAPAPKPISYERTRVFVSYSHQDSKLLQRLHVHLKPLERSGKVDRWDDTRLRTSHKWRDEIKNAIAATKVAVLLISADFLASSFIHDNELPPLLLAAQNEGAFIMPVIIKPCSFTSTPILSDFQAVNDPSKPLISLQGANREALWAKLTKDIDDALSGRL